MTFEPRPDPIPAPGPSGVHVWLVGPEEADQAARALLSPDELERLEAFRFDVHRERFLAARAGLRRILAAYTAAPAGELRFAYGARGKPALPDYPDLHFNLSRSDAMVLVAVTRAGAVGVDVEQVRPLADRERLARRNFAPAEVAALEALPEEQRLLAFFTCWTRKEAYVKAVGEGLGLALDGFEVTVRPDEEPAFVDMDDWHLIDVSPAPDYPGALAVAGARPEVRCFRWR